LLSKSDPSGYEFHPHGENVRNGQSTYRSGLEHFGPALSCSNEKESSSQMTSTRLGWMWKNIYLRRLKCEKLFISED
jgi:hypothetical protein